ncbi:MAG: glycoside hydrolase family 32 protein [Chloroflexota bacterium]
MDEPFRPQIHFTPPEKWINDPNGMVYYDGEYHLFYQYYPEDTVWGPMHWGHAVSRDLVNWEHLPIALSPDELGYIFSGSAVIDWQNTADFGAEAMVAIYTYHDPANRNQSQAIAYSLDNGRSWTKYAGNPVIPTPPNIRNFRDPKVMWYDGGDGAEGDNGHWVMSLAAGSAILFFTSPNLKAWEPSGSFGFGYGSTGGVWETPDLFELPVGDSGETRWVLTVGLGNGAPAEGSGMQYFVGDFDGQTFTSENPRNTVLWADYGADFYAAQSWSDVLNSDVLNSDVLSSDEPNSRRLWLAWLNNWHYAPKIPTSTWRGAMSLPREVRLVEADEGIRMVQTAVPELTQLRTTQHRWQNITVQPNAPFVPDVQGELLEIIAKIETPIEANSLGIRVRVGESEATTIGYAPKSSAIFVDRTKAGQADFHDNFAKLHIAQLDPIDDAIKLHIFVDRSAVEVFANDGLVTFAERIFPSDESVGVEVFVEGETAVVVRNLEIYELKAAQFFITAQSE